MGMCPKVLTKVIEDLCEDGKRHLAHLITEKILWKIMKRGRKIYQSRCKEHKEIAEVKKYRDLAKEEVARMKGD